MPEAASGVTLRLVLAVAAILTGLFLVDRFLARLEQQELRREAIGSVAEGDRLLAGGHAADAAKRYQRAHALFRGDRQYALDYARALLAAGDRPRAESTLRDVLDRDSNDAPANLLMARVMLAGGDAAAADSYYHRAIYGAWPADADAQRLRARLELADWLAQRHARDELLAELLPLQAAAPARPALRRRVADLLLAAGSPARAAEAYRALLHADPEDAGAWRGLGEAEFQRGNYRAAQRVLQEAVRRNPSDTELAARLHTAAAVNALDPTPRRLVQLTAAALRACAGSPPAPPVTALLAEAGANQTSEARLNLAEKLWRARAVYCPPESNSSDPVQIVMEKLLAQ